MDEKIIRYQNDISKGRTNLIVMVTLTVVNIILYFANASVVFPFSAYFPQLAAGLGYELYTNMGYTIVLIIGIVSAIFMLALYLLCYFMSKKHWGWMVAALTLFIIDTILYLILNIPDFEVSMLIDVVFHGWVLYYLFLAVKAAKKLKVVTMQTETEQIAAE